MSSVVSLSAVASSTVGVPPPIGPLMAGDGELAGEPTLNFVGGFETVIVIVAEALSPLPRSV